MKTIRLIVDFTYDEYLMYADDNDGKEWFLNMLTTESLDVHSDDVGDFIGKINVLAFLVNESELTDEDETV